MAYSKISRHARGYGSAWDRLRLVILKRDGYRCRCEDCTANCFVKAATHVDHIVRKADGGTDDPSNLRAISKDCHALKTIREKGWHANLGTSASGLPLDPTSPWARGPLGQGGVPARKSPTPPSTDSKNPLARPHDR